MSKRSLVILFGLGLFLGQIPVLYMLSRTEFAEIKREQNPFTRRVSVGASSGVAETGSDAGGSESGIRIPAEHLASYLVGNLVGGMKQVAITSLWVKYGRLKDEERYDEAVALLQILQVLQPEREQVWAFLARDIAFQISMSQPDLSSEWAKVKRGIQILKDGNRRMQGSVRLLQELGWIYGIRVPQEPYMMRRTWKESAENGPRRTNYRLALEYYRDGWERAKQQGRRERLLYMRNFGFMVNYCFYDIVMLMHFGAHDLARKRVSRARELTRNWIRAYADQSRVPRPYVVRENSYRDLPELIEVDRTLAEVPWKTEEQKSSNRRRKMKRTREFLKAWASFFHRYEGALAEEAVRHVLRHSFELLYYVTRDFERYYRTGEERFETRAERFLEQVLFPRIQDLVPKGSNVGGGYLRRARTDLAVFQEQMKQNYRLQRTLNTTDSREEKRRARRDLESVYTELLDLYHRNHRGFHMKWFRKELNKLESEEVLDF